MNVPADIPSWCEIYPAAIERNLERAIDLLPTGARLCAVLKGDAYGHGIENVIPALLKHGICEVGIVSNQEARAVREAGFEGHIMRLRGCTLAEAQAALDLGVEEQVASVESAQQWARLGAQCDVHLSLNAGGMGRDGLEVSTAQGKQTARDIVRLCGERIRGIGTHYPSHDPHDLKETGARFARDAKWVIEATTLDPERVLLHAGSSLTLIDDAPPPTHMMRCGAILYGILRHDLGFEPAMALRSRVCSLASYPAGASVGYDRSERLTRDSRIASVSIGYANGIGRDWVGTKVLIRGVALPVIGKVSMNVLSVDVTGLRDVAVGDEATLFGRQAGGVLDQGNAEAQARTLMADLYTGWGKTNPRYLA